MDNEKRTKPKWSRKKQIRWSLIGLGALIVILIGAAVFSHFRSNSSVEKSDKYATYKVKEGEPLIFKGSVIPSQTKEIYLDSTKGSISSISVTDGQTVKTGDVILTYNNDTVQEQVTTQESALNKASLAVKNAQDSLTNAINKRDELQQKLNSSRSKLNAEKGDTAESAANKQQYQAEVSQYEEALSSAKDALTQGQQALDSANIDLQDQNKQVESVKEKVTTNVTASMDGIAYVNPAGQTEPTTAVVKIVSPSVTIQGTVSEYDYPSVKKDQTVTIMPVANDQKIQGKITAVDQLPASSTAVSGGASSTAAAAASSSTSSIANYNFTVAPDSAIQYGYNVQIKVPLAEIKVPSSAVRKEDGKLYVYLYQDGKAKRTEITGTESRGAYVVDSGLTKGQKILQSPDKDVKDGAKATVE